MQHHYKLSSVTVQSALDHLCADGFVVTRGRLGSFIADFPPHLHRFGLVLGNVATANYFTQALASVAKAPTRDGNSVEIYQALLDYPEGESAVRLSDDLRASRIGGMLLSASHLVQRTVLRGYADVPKVAIMQSHGPDELMSGIRLDTDSLISSVIQQVVARKRRRLAIIGATGQQTAFLRSLAVAASQANLEMRPHWNHFLEPLPNHDAARSLTHLLFHADQRERPDCLFIADDNLVESASIGLVAAQVRVPDDVDVIGHANFPLNTRSLVPMTRVGYNAQEVVSQGMDMLKELIAQRVQRVADRRIFAHIAIE